MMVRARSWCLGRPAPALPHAHGRPAFRVFGGYLYPSAVTENVSRSILARRFRGVGARTAESGRIWPRWEVMPAEERFTWGVFPTIRRELAPEPAAAELGRRPDLGRGEREKRLQAVLFGGRRVDENGRDSGPRLPPGPDRAAPGARPPARSSPDHALQEASAPADRDSGGRSGGLSLGLRGKPLTGNPRAGRGARGCGPPLVAVAFNRRRRSIVVQAEKPASAAADAMAYARYLCSRVVQLGLRRPSIAGLYARSQECVAAVGLEAQSRAAGPPCHRRLLIVGGQRTDGVAERYRCLGGGRAAKQNGREQSEQYGCLHAAGGCHATRRIRDRRVLVDYGAPR